MNIGDQFKLIMHDTDRANSSNHTHIERFNRTPIVSESMAPKVALLIRGINAHLSLPQYSIKEDKIFMHADDVEETHVRDNWERE